jgi:hypothetical protein
MKKGFEEKTEDSVSALVLECLFLGFFTWLASLFVLGIVRIQFPTSLLFDQFCLLTMFLSIVTFLILKLGRYGFLPKLMRKDTFTKVLIATVSGLLFFSTVQYSVLAVDRSRSLYIFSWVEEGLITKSSSGVSVSDSSVDPEGLRDIISINQRIEEQEARGLMKSNSDEVQLTFSGKLVLGVAKFFAATFNLKGWYLHT